MRKILLLLALLAFSETSHAVSSGLLLGSGGASNSAAYANFAAFPVVASTGFIAVDQSTGDVYVYQGGAWLLVASPSTVTTIGAINGQAKVANGATVVGNTIYLQTADVAFSGLLSAADWATFNAKEDAANKSIDGTFAANSDVLYPSQKAAKTYADTKIPLTQKAAANGVATLDGAGKIPTSQLPNSVMEFQGQWDASTNTPVLADGVGNVGDTYRVNVAGTQNLGSGNIAFAVADWAMYDGAVWQLAHAGADVVQSVNGFTGVVTLAAADIAYTPVAANWAVDPATVQAALDNLAGAKIGALWYVSRSSGVNSAACGMILNPCLTISQALTNMGAAANAADVKKPQTVLIEGGSYDEAITIPDGRIVNLIAMGTVVLGDGAGANWASTTPRNVNFSPTNAGVFGSDIKPALTIGAINPSDATTTFVAESNGFYISGDLQLNGSGVSHTLNLFGVKLAGSMTKTSLGLTNIQAYKSYFIGPWTLSAGQTILERIDSCEFDALITADSFNYIVNSELDAGITVVANANTMPPSGVFQSTIFGTFTGPAASAKFDLATDYFFRANGAVLAGGATRVIISPYATAAIDGILSSTDWSTFNNKQPAGNYITALTGDVTAAGPGSVAATIANDAVTDAKLRNSSALSVIGRSSNSVGDPADIAAGADFNILRRSGVVVGFGAIDLSQAGAVGASVLGTANGGRGTELQELPAGAINNVNVTFTVSQTPIAAVSVKLYQDGLLLVQGTDYTIAGSTITMAVAPDFGQRLYANFSF